MEWNSELTSSIGTLGCRRQVPACRPDGEGQRNGDRHADIRDDCTDADLQSPHTAPEATDPVPHAPRSERDDIAAATLIHGDCRQAHEVDPIPERRCQSIARSDLPRGEPGIRTNLRRLNGTSLMKSVVGESRRILKPKGSAVFVLQPNYESLGKMRLWLWEFVVWAGREWNLVQDPTGGRSTQCPWRGRIANAG